MKQFSGFPVKMEFTSIPNIFFSSLLPQIEDITELKVTLHILEILYRKRGYPRFVTYKELLGSANLLNSLKQASKPSPDALRDALELATKRETLLHLALDREGATEDIYFLNANHDRQTIAKIQSGTLQLPGLKLDKQDYIETEEQPDLFTLYEQNIGLLTPMIADELREAEKLYPESWIKDAIKEAVSLNKRNIRYIMRILENWSTEGRSDGTHKRNSKKTDPDKYIKGKYGHMVKR